MVLSVDRVQVRDRLNGEFTHLNLDRAFYIGGVPHMENGIVVHENFTGCIENMYLNHSNVIAGFNHGVAYDDRFYNYEAVGRIVRTCDSDVFSVPATFKNRKSHVRLTGVEGTAQMNVSLEFRTFEENGLLIYHRFSSAGFVKLFLEDARIKVIIVASDMPKVELDNFDQTYNDGKWHQVEISMGKNKAVLTIDRIPMDTRRRLDMATGGYYMIAGGVYGEPGFIGCMRRIVIDGKYKEPTRWGEEEYSSLGDVALGSCHLVDRCTPSPCEHGGVCKQGGNSTAFNLFWAFFGPLLSPFFGPCLLKWLTENPT